MTLSFHPWRMRIPLIAAFLTVVAPSCQVNPGGVEPSAAGPQSKEDTTGDRLARAEATPAPCLYPGDPTEEAYYVTTGPSDGMIILPNGRKITPTGDQVELGVFPFNVIAGPNNRYAYVTNGGDGTKMVEQVDLTTGVVVSSLTLDKLFHGLVLNSDGSRIYAAGGESESVYEIEVGDPGLTLRSTWSVERYPMGLALTPDDAHLLVAANLSKEIVEIDVATGEEFRRIKTDLLPYQIVVSPDGQFAYVSQWSERSVSVIDLSSGRVLDTLKTAKNPAGLVLSTGGDLLFVASSDGDQIEVFNAIERRSLRKVDVGIYADGYHGASPNSLALADADSRIYVVNAGDNSLEIYDASNFRYLGALPTAWYPSAVAITPDGSKLLIANGKGEGAGPTPEGIEASKLMPGTLSIVSMPLSSDQLAEGDLQVIENNSRPMTLHEINCSGKMFPIPEDGQSSPIEHVVLILRENKTYDAYLGDLEVGDGDPDMVLFGEEITPNTHELARQFTLLDNFYTDSEDSDQGHLWATSAFVNDYSERTNAAGRLLATGVGGASDTETRYIFDAMLQAGVDWVNYGEVVGIEAATLGNIDMHYPGVFFNLNVKDEVKAQYVISQINKGVMPPFTFLSLPDDHTEGTEPGELTPESMVSDNDYGVGLVIDAISKSEYWPTTAIFVFEDDPQDGADHVEAHRSPAFVVSPWAKREYVSSVHYSIASVLRTIEMILDVPPMTQYDAMATPMYDCFTAVPDYAPYDVIPRQIEDAYNTRESVGARESSKMDFSGPDRARGLGEVIWRYRKGTEPPLMFGFERDDDD